MSVTIVRYRVAPGRGEENAALVRAVYAELADRRPPAFRYATYVAEDGVSFCHVAFTEDGTPAPLPGLPAFGRFREALEARCDGPPETTRLHTRVGSYRV